MIRQCSVSSLFRAVLTSVVLLCAVGLQAATPMIGLDDNASDNASENVAIDTLIADTLDKGLLKVATEHVIMAKRTKVQRDWSTWRPAACTVDGVDYPRRRTDIQPQILEVAHHLRRVYGLSLCDELE